MVLLDGGPEGITLDMPGLDCVISLGVYKWFDFFVFLQVLIILSEL